MIFWNGTLYKLYFGQQTEITANINQSINPFVKVASEDHTNNDCLAIAVLTTGTSNFLKADNMFYTPQMLWTPFLSDSCPSLNNKPKLFFLQVSYFFSFFCLEIYFVDIDICDQSAHETNFP